MACAVRHRPRPFKDSGALHPLPRYEAAMTKQFLLVALLLSACGQSSGGSADARAAPAPPGQCANRPLRRRLLLVGRARHRGGSGCRRGGVGLRRRPRRQSELRAGGARRHRPYRGGSGDLRSGADQLSRARPPLPAHDRSDRRRRPVLRPRRAITAPRSSPSTRPSGATPQAARGRGQPDPARPGGDAGARRRRASTPAEAYHQDYARRNPAAYSRYRRGCGKDARIRAVWGPQGAAH